MTAWKLRDEIAKERFLDMMAGAEPTVTEAHTLAAIAVEQADILVSALAAPQHEVSIQQPRVYIKPCPSCDGSRINKKSNRACLNCGATGQVEA